ncbi:MAG: GMC family oxidoreductase [Myxococcales bacterium]|nr:GMC family oxidoreductase [Myxococcales bacterium]
MPMPSAQSDSGRKATLRALAGVVCPPEIADKATMEACLVETERAIGALPKLVRSGLAAGLLAYEFGAILWPPARGRRASRLEGDFSARYFHAWWHGRLRLFREFSRGARQILTLSYYETPQAKEALGYDPEVWIARVKARRLESYGEEIREREAEVTAPDPLPGAERAYEILSEKRRGAASERGAILSARRDLPPSGTLDCDVVIVGSGAGGGPMAAELAEAGLDVIVLEEGSHNRTEDFTADASEMVRRMYRDGGATIAYGTPPVYFQEGRTVGGSTVVNGGMSWRTPDEILQRWRDADGLDGILPKDLEPFAERVERRVHVAYQDPESIGRDNELLKVGADRKGWETIPNLRNQLHCAGSNNCAFGCPTGAKRSVLVTYIPRAVRFGARVFADLRVTKILREGIRAVGVEGRVAEPGGGRGRKVTVRAKLVVVSCGAIQTPALLARSGIRSTSGRLGRNLSLHPNAKVGAVFDEDVRGWEGVHQAWQVRQFREEGLVMAAVNIPPSIVAMTSHLYGRPLAEMMREYRHIVTAGLLVEDTSLGRVVTLPGGEPLALYQINDQDIATLRRGLALLSELLFEAGARKIYLPFAGLTEIHGPDELKRITDDRIPKKSIEIVTVHMMGTARMGGDPRSSVTDSYGRVHGARGLMVSDASLFPSPIGVNPSQTIQTLAIRNAAHILNTGLERL